MCFTRKNGVFLGLLLLATAGSYALAGWLTHLVNAASGTFPEQDSPETLAVLFWVVATLAVPAGVVGTALARDRRPGMVALGCGLAYLLGGSGGRASGVDQRWLTMEAMARRSQPLIQAIRAYERDHGSPPDGLDALVPDYLPKVPETGISVYPTYLYNRAEDGAGAGNPWQLRVPTPRRDSFLSFDRMLYLPKQNYELAHLRKPWQKCGDWVYMWD